MRPVFNSRFTTPESGGWLTGVACLWTLLPNVSSSSSPLSLSLSSLSPLLSSAPSLSSIARLRSPTRHRRQGCSEGAAQPEKWQHHASCGSIHPFPSWPACFSFARCHRAELYGITRRMKVGVLTGLVVFDVSWWLTVCAVFGWLDGWTDGWMRSPGIPRFFSPGEGECEALETLVKCSAQLWMMH